jgi:glycosyltransferase involved in cell wall biosynthesis
MVNGALVVSDPVYAPEPFVPGVHFVEAPVEELAATCRHWLDDPAGRARITAAAHALVMQELTLENVLARLVALVDDASASPQAPRS